MLYSICYILPMSHHVIFYLNKTSMIPDCIPMSYPWHVGLQVASEAAVQRPLLRCHPDTEEEVWRCGDVALLWDFHPEKLGNCWEIQRNWRKFTGHGLAKALWVGAGPSWISRRDFTIKAAPCSPANHGKTREGP